VSLEVTVFCILALPHVILGVTAKEVNNEATDAPYRIAETGAGALLNK